MIVILIHLSRRFQVVPEYFSHINGLSWSENFLFIADDQEMYQFERNRVRPLKGLAANVVSKQIDAAVAKEFLPSDLYLLAFPQDCLNFNGLIEEPEDPLRFLRHAIDEFGEENEFFAGFDDEGHLILPHE